MRGCDRSGGWVTPIALAFRTRLLRRGYELFQSTKDKGVDHGHNSDRHG